MQEYNGANVVDAAGEKIGTVERTYADSDGIAQAIEVKLGGLFSRHRIIPLDDVQMTDAGIQAPYSKATIEASPDASGAADTVDSSFVDDVRSYYSGQQAAVVPGQQGQDQPEGDET